MYYKLIGSLVDHFENRKDCLIESFVPYVWKYFHNDWNLIEEEINDDDTFQSFPSSDKEEEIQFDSFDFFSESNPAAVKQVCNGIQQMIEEMLIDEIEDSTIFRT